MTLLERRERSALQPTARHLHHSQSVCSTTPAAHTLLLQLRPAKRRGLRLGPPLPPFPGMIYALPYPLAPGLHHLLYLSLSRTV